ncbi:MAG TPA: ABC transporter permease subunit [Acidimicrobiia bacterium]|nr:ABC transporter permease subunit [Acidimicrobiia bacterium]
MATKETTKRETDPVEGQRPPDGLEHLIHGEDLIAEPLWKIRFRLFRRSFAQNWGLFKDSKMGIVGLLIILLFGVMAVVQPILLSTVWDPAIYDPVSGYDAVVTEFTVVENDAVEDPTSQLALSDARFELNPTIDVGDTARIPAQPAPPTLGGEEGHAHFLGTDPQGRDIFSQLLYGARAAFLLGFVAAFTTVFIATTVGSIAAYYGGKLDGFLMRTADLILLMPLLPVLIVLSAAVQINMVMLGIMIGVLLGFGGDAIVLKSQALSIKVKSYIDAARVAGGGDGHIIFRHIIPNVVPLSLLYMMFGVTTAIALEATLSFLGLLNIQMSWGIMINTASTQGYLLSGTSYWWLLFPAGLAVSFLAFGFFVVGRGMDEVINPRLRAR